MVCNEKQLKELNKLCFGAFYKDITECCADYLNMRDGMHVTLVIGNYNAWDYCRLSFELSGLDIADARNNGLTDLQHIARTVGNILNRNLPNV